MAVIPGRKGGVYIGDETIEDTSDAWTADNASTAATDADIPTGTSGTSVKIVVPDIGANLLLAHEVISLNISDRDVVRLWVKCSISLTAGQVQLILDDTATGLSPLKLMDIPALSSGTWTRILLDMGDASGLTAVLAVGVKQVADLGAYNLFVKDIQAVSIVDGIKSWNLTAGVETLDSTDFQDGQATNSGRTFISGLSNWSGSFEGYKDAVPLELSFSSTVAIALAASQTAGQAWIGDAYITNITPTAPVDGIVTYSYDFQGTGLLEVASV
ncbi:hypothetical protein LCGC14_2269740 [marine sediment metagenome]|uniref:Uncharacterized protein n=1 Tax=marine sediment metagenome TaxID=412755 RepID=A0A0F9DJI7_9ZZZZ